MKQILVVDIMVPLSYCLTVQKDYSLLDVFQALDQTRKSKNESLHKDSVVFDENGAFLGTVTMIDIFKALEPNYSRVKQQHKTGSMLSAGAYLKIAEDFNLWLEPTHTIRHRAGQLKVVDVMHIPEQIEYIKEEENLEKAMHIYVMGVHQPLIVKNADNEVTGVLRFGDIFEAFRQSLLDPSIS
jgi:CBS domain containing-hemolysin-like protein